MAHALTLLLRCCRWEAVVVVRKSLLSSIAVFFAGSYHAQSTFGLVLMLVSCIHHARAYPFEDRSMNRLELASLSVSGVTFLCGQFTYVDLGYGSSTQALMSTFALLVNVGFLVALICKFYSAYKQSIVCGFGRVAMNKGRKVVAALEGAKNSNNNRSIRAVPCECEARIIKQVQLHVCNC